MKRRKFILGSILGCLFPFKKKQSRAKVRWILGGQRTGKGCIFTYPVSAEKPKLVIDGEYGIVLYDKETIQSPHILWECSDTLYFENHCYIWEFVDLYDFRSNGCHLTYDIPVMNFLKIGKNRDVPRYLRVSVNGVLADNIIDLWNPALWCNSRLNEKS